MIHYDFSKLPATNAYEKIFLQLKKGPHSKILLAGGSTPIEFYSKYLKKLNANFLVSDERITSDAKRHNQNNIAEKFSDFQKIQFPLEKKTIKKFTQNLTKIYKDFSPADLCILGMGEDGHYASIFSESETILDCSEKQYIFCEINDKKEIRFSLTEDYIASSKRIFLLVKSENKKKIQILQSLTNCTDLNLPINLLYKKCSKKMSIISF